MAKVPHGSRCVNTLPRNKGNSQAGILSLGRCVELLSFQSDVAPPLASYFTDLGDGCRWDGEADLRHIYFGDAATHVLAITAEWLSESQDIAETRSRLRDVIELLTRADIALADEQRRRG